MSPPRKIPTRGELLRLQKLYRTDKKIAEVLGNGVTEHLVGYWRRKKGIARHSFPKFSEKEIRELWDRFGDDFRAGMEIGISKAAFYNWRRRYKITKKPEALKLEQLSLELHTPGEKPRRAVGGGHQTVTQKILALRADRDSVSVGEEVKIEPDVVLAPADSAPVVKKFLESGTSYVWNPNRVVMPLDGSVATTAGEAAELHKTVRDFARRQQMRSFFDVGEGSPPQVIVEKGLILPGQLGVGCESRAISIGSIGALALSVPPDDIPCLWADGRVTFAVPESIRIFIEGRTPRGVFARDIIHDIIARLKGTDVVRGRIIEFYGIGVERMSISERMTLCHAAIPVSAAAAFCAFDATTRRYINPRARKGFAPMMADRNAIYADEYTFETNKMKPTASGPNSFDTVVPVEQLESTPIQQVCIGGMANGRFDDLKIAADILKGKRANPEVRLFVHPVSRAVYLESLKKGLLRVFIEAGGIVLNPGGPMASQMTALAGDEKGLTTHFESSFDVGAGECYQVSPATAAASALTGQITNPSGYVKV